MSAFRVLGFCYLAAASGLVLAIATADKARLHDLADRAGHGISERLEDSTLQPALTFARALDRWLFDPPQNIVRLQLDAPGPNDARTYAHATVLPRTQARVAEQALSQDSEPLMIAPDLPPLETEGVDENEPAEPSRSTAVPPSGPQALVQARLEKNLTPELRDNFDLFLFVSKASRGPAAQRLYVFRKTTDHKATGHGIELLYDWAASTGRERIEVSPWGRRTFTATPTGIYQFDPNRMYRHYTSRAWIGEMPYAMFFNWEREGTPTGVAIHAATAKNMARLGKRDSAGCIHISARHAALLYDMIRSNYRGSVPQFTYDPGSRTMSNRGELMRDGTQLKMMDGYRVLIDVEDFSGASRMASLD